jgi:hypothetical protein
VAQFSTLRSIGESSRIALGVLTGALVALVAQTHDANAFEVKKTTKGELVHWEESTVQYTVDGSLDLAVDTGSKALVQAMGSWSGTVGAPDLETIPVTADSPKAPGFDHKNGVFYIKGGYTPAGKALAITVLTYDNNTGKIMDADMIVNGIYNFAVLPATETYAAMLNPSDAPTDTDAVSHSSGDGVNGDIDVYDLHHVVAHELGHSLGMNDELALTHSLMYRYSEPNDASTRSPGSDDIAGLAELYQDRVGDQKSGCGSSTVAPKKPSRTASSLATFAAFGLALFLALRARKDRRARLAFVLAAAAGAVTLLPDLSGKRGVARAAELVPASAVGHARATVVGTTTSIEKGLFKTSYKLATTGCNVGACPPAGHGESWGGTIGNITQEVGGQYAPKSGDAVDISFASLPSALKMLANPLAGRPVVESDAAVRVLTRAAR